MELTHIQADAAESRYRPQRRAGPALGAVLLQLLVGYALIAGLAVELRARTPDTLDVFAIVTPPPPADMVPRHRATSRKADGAAAPANLKAVPTDIVAPPPVVTPPLPPLPAAPIAGRGTAAASGAAPVPGPGTGAGGQGKGTGSGDSGDGDGDGDWTPPRWLSGRIKDSDYPKPLWEAGIGGTLDTRFTVGVNGRVTGCAVTKSSGNATLDSLTCHILEQRFRYAAARDENGRPVADEVEGEHVWEAHRQEEEPEPN
jgi:protein TonB